MMVASCPTRPRHQGRRFHRSSVYLTVLVVLTILLPIRFTMAIPNVTTTTVRAPPRRIVLRYRRGQKHAVEKWMLEHNTDKITIHHSLHQLNVLVLTASERDIAMLRNNHNLVLSIEDDPKRYPLSTLRGGNNEQPPRSAQHLPTSDKPTPTRETNRRTSIATPPDLPPDLPTGVHAVKAPALWEQGLRGQNTTVCIVDSGLDPFHPDFDWSAIESTTDDSIGHGTHISGTVAGRYTGVAPEASLRVVRVFDGHGNPTFASEVIMALFECITTDTTNNGDNDNKEQERMSQRTIINLSLGGMSPSPLEEEVLKGLQKDGILVVAAAGTYKEDQTGNDNNIADKSISPAHEPLSYPAGYTSALSVAAVDSRDGRFAPFTNTYGIDVSAPGVRVWSTFPTSRPCVYCTVLNEYIYGLLSGTSAAAAHVSGVLALLLSASDGWSTEHILRAVRESPDKEGNGMIDAEAAYRRLQSSKIPTTSSSASHHVSRCPILGQVEVRLELRTDASPEDTWFTLENVEETHSESLSSSSSLAPSFLWKYSNLQPLQHYVFRECIEDDQCHLLKIYDRYGDGLCCAHGMGGYEVLYDGQRVERGAIFGSSVEIELGPCDNQNDSNNTKNDPM